MEATRFGVGERVRYAMDWPELDAPDYLIRKGTCATVVLVPPGAGEVYLVRLDEALSGFRPEMSVAGRYLEPE